MKSPKIYSLRKSHQILKTSYKWYKKRGQQLPLNQLRSLEEDLEALDRAILAKDQIGADALAHKLESFNQTHFSKTWWEYTLELVFAILVALAIATVVRQVWFELYEIPTGSMRPTFKEQDHLTVTKTAFGINVPLMTKHLYFDPSLVQRTSVFIWSGDGVAHLDSDSTFMGIFPYTKRYIKRCMGKPGDTLYFYGGKIYGMDAEGQDLVELRDNQWLKELEYIPFINFEGRVSTVQDPLRSSQIIFHHMNEAIGRLVFSRTGQIKGEIFNGKEWIKDNPEAQRFPHSTIQTYSDFWGMRNFAMARLLTKEQVERLTDHRLDDMEEGILYLELRHTPSLSYPPPILSEKGFALSTYRALIPLQEEHVKALMNHMYTARFVVRDGKVDRYRIENNRFSSQSPQFSGVPDGTYEFYHGKAVKIGWGGITSAVPADSPLYKTDPEHVQKLFNMGIELSKWVEPQSRNQTFFPNRYAYFREGDLYLLGAPIFKKEDPILQAFLKREIKREEESSEQTPYVAFKDYGPPLKDGKLDQERIQVFGYRVPEGHYLALGDNHAMSQDSRFFGPVPQANIQGAPVLIIWPPGDRWGCPNQKPYPLITLPRVIIWSIAAAILLAWWIWRRKQLSQPVYKKVDFST
jgi:signal peptidase I